MRGRSPKETARTALAAVARRQFGIIRRDQALEVVTRRCLEGMLARGELTIVRRGVYGIVGAQRVWEAEVVAALAAAGPGAVACGRTAARLHRLQSVVPTLEIATPHTIRLQGVTCRCLNLLPSEIRRRGIFAFTTIERTLLDVAATIDAVTLETCIDSALNQGLTTIPRLQNYLASRGGKGRRGVNNLRGMVAVRDPNASHESALETRLFRLIRLSNLPTPVPQHVVEGLEGFVAKIDFAYPDLNLAIEAMGWEHHGGRLRWKQDLHD